MQTQPAAQVFSHLNELRALEAHWRSLAGTIDTTLSTFDWVFAAAKNFYADGDLHVISLRRADVVVAIAPLAFTKRDGVTWLEIIGASDLHEPGGLLYADEASLRGLCEAITASPWPVALERIVTGGVIAQHLRRLRARPGRVVDAGTTESTRVDITSDWPDYAQKLSTRRRSDYRQSRRAIERNGSVHFSLIQPTESEAPELLSAAFAVESRSWKGAAGSSLARNPRLAGFFRDLGSALAARGELLIALMHLNEKPIAMQIAVRHAKVYWLLKIGYDPLWARYSPGFQLMMDVIREVHERKLRRIEFMGSDEPWLRVWANGARTYDNLFFFPYTKRGLSAVAKIATRRFLQHIRQDSAVQ